MKNKKQMVDHKSEALLKYASGIIATLKVPFLVLDKDLRVISANQIFYTTFKVTKRDTIGRSFPDLGNRQWAAPEMLRILKKILFKKKVIENYEVEYEFEQADKRVICLNINQLCVPEKIATMIVSGVKRKAEKVKEKVENLTLMTIEDITERKQPGKALAQSKERKYRTLIENLPQKIFLKDTNSVFVSCNENYARDLKIKAEEISGKTDYDFFPAYLADKYRADDKRIMESGEIENIEEQYIIIGDFRSDFQEIIINTVKVPIHDESGNVTGILGIFWDVTERRKSEDQIRNLKKQMEYILGATKTGLDIIDSSFNMVYIDPEWQKVYGDQKGKKCYEYFMGMKKECTDCGVRKAFETKSTMVTEEVLVKEGNRVVQVTSIPFQDKDNNWFVAEVNVDITERKKSEGQLRQEKERAELIYNVVPSAIFTVDNDRHITSWNDTAVKLTGYTTEEAIGKECFIFAEDPCKEKCGLYADDVNKPIFGKECIIKRKDGDIRIISKNVDFLHDLDGNIIGGVESFQDITEHKRAEKQLEISGRKIRALFDQTFQFIGMMTPDGKLVEANRSAMQFAGIKESD
ncbi:MAG: PAS domain S-box protein, partial [Candidatus Omnitrophota bacterium]